MPDENIATPDQNPTPPAAPAPQPGAYSQADVDRLVSEASRKAHDAAWAEARRREAATRQRPAAADAPQPRTETPPEPQAHPDPLAILKLRDDFDDATADLQLAAPQRRFLREQVMATRPPDVAAFVRGFVDVWGSKPAAPAATTSVTNPAPTTSAQPATAMLGTTPPATVTADTPLTSLGKTDLDAAIRRLGPHEFSKRWMSELAASGKRIPIR